MKPVSFIASVLLLVAVSDVHIAMAQSPPQGEMLMPTPLEATDPRAKDAAAVVDLILKGERTAVLTLLREKGTPAYAKSPDLEKAVEAQITRLANQGYTIAEFLTGRGADVIVELAAKSGEPTNLVIRFTTDAPHRIEGFARAMPG
jgi:hypothetical protein